MCDCITSTQRNNKGPDPQIQYQTENFETQYTLPLLSLLVKISSMYLILFIKYNSSNRGFNEV